MFAVEEAAADDAAAARAVAVETRVVDELELPANPERVHVQACIDDVGLARQRGREGGGGGGGGDDGLLEVAKWK